MMLPSSESIVVQVFRLEGEDVVVDGDQQLSDNELESLIVSHVWELAARSGDTPRSVYDRFFAASIDDDGWRVMQARLFELAGERAGDSQPNEETN